MIGKNIALETLFTSFIAAKQAKQRLESSNT